MLAAPSVWALCKPGALLLDLSATQAGSVVQQSVSQMRTVAAYNGEERSLKDYDQHLDKPVKVGIGSISRRLDNYNWTL